MKINTIKSWIFIVISFLAYNTTYAQVKQEYSVYGAGGISSFRYSSEGADIDKKVGGSFGLGYSYFFTNNWAITSGAELSVYKSKIEARNYSDSYMTQDNEMENFEYQYTIGGYNEHQTAMYVNIPIMLQFQSNEDNGFYAALGGKIGIPVSDKYKSSISSIKTQGYYPANNVIYDDLLFSGFGTYTAKGSKDDLDLKVAFLLSADVGVKSRLSETLSLYTGLYFDYGLNNVAKDGKTFVAYDSANPTKMHNNSIMTSQYNSGGEKKSFVSKVHPIAFGLKMRLAFGNR